MTFDELRSTLNKAMALFGAGTIAGYIIANVYLITHATVFAILAGLLCSLRPFTKWVNALIKEYKQLKEQENENTDIS